MKAIAYARFEIAQQLPRRFARRGRGTKAIEKGGKPSHSATRRAAARIGARAGGSPTTLTVEAAHDERHVMTAETERIIEGVANF